MSSQYRAWRDHLASCLVTYAPGTQYSLLHTANLIGLFTCVFVKSSERNRIRDLNAAEVKVGLGGTLGNKVGVLSVAEILQADCHDRALLLSASPLTTVRSALSTAI